MVLRYDMYVLNIFNAQSYDKLLIKHFYFFFGQWKTPNDSTTFFLRIILFCTVIIDIFIYRLLAVVVPFRFYIHVLFSFLILFLFFYLYIFNVDCVPVLDFEFHCNSTRISCYSEIHLITVFVIKTKKSSAVKLTDCNVRFIDSSLWIMISNYVKFTNTISLY